MLARMQQRRACNWAVAEELVAASAALQEALPAAASS
jgi:hypothetical protein